MKYRRTRYGRGNSQDNTGRELTFTNMSPLISNNGNKGKKNKKKYDYSIRILV